MQKTKNDLCYDEAKVDYCSLVRVAMYAFNAARRDAQNAIRETEEGYDENLVGMYMGAERAVEASKRLQDASEVLHTLRGGISRAKKKFTNIPSVECQVWNEVKEKKQ